MTLTNPIVELDAVTLTLAGPAGPVNVLRGVELNASRPGESVGLMGPSGAGKTSLMMIVAGFGARDLRTHRRGRP